jgi:lipopolysaccharide/colanic/teichoic acid biosynthesis glycosyltransferase
LYLATNAGSGHCHVRWSAGGSLSAPAGGGGNHLHRRSLGGPIFVQDRVGKNGKRFRFLKFRSMVVNAEELLKELEHKNEMDGPVFKIKDDPRVTKFGKWIRKTSIDELPQLINIIKGEMSIVGPRPPLPREVEKYGPYEKQRLLVKPGLTCYWQARAEMKSGLTSGWNSMQSMCIITTCGLI